MIAEWRSLTFNALCDEEQNMAQVVVEKRANSRKVMSSPGRAAIFIADQFIVS